METKAKAEDTSTLWRIIVDSFKRIRQDGEKNLAKKVNLSLAEFRILSMLHDGSCQMSMISTEIGLTQAAVTGIVDKLEDLMLARRVRSNKDRRIIEIRITQKGERTLKKARRAHAEFVEHSLASLEAQELRELSIILQKLAGAMDAFNP